MYFSNLEYCLKFMGYCGANPEKSRNKLQKLLYFVNLSANCFVFLTAICHFLLYEGSFQVNNLSTIMEGVITISHGTLKLFILRSKRSEILDLLQRTESFWRIESLVNVNLRTTCFKTLRWLKVTSATMILLAICTVLLFMISPLLNKNNGILNSQKMKWMPSPLAILLEQYILVFSVAMPILCFDVFYQTIIILIQVQFQILNHEITGIFKQRRQRIVTENIRINRINLWVDQHNFLLDIVARMNQTLSTPLLVYFGIISLTVCVELFNLTNQKNLSFDLIMKLIMYLLAGLFEFSVFYCIPAQLLINEASRVSFNMFSNFNWDRRSRHLAFSARMIILRGHQSIKLWIGNIAIINLETFLQTIRSTFSFYMFLRTIVEKKEMKQEQVVNSHAI